MSQLRGRTRSSPSRRTRMSQVFLRRCTQLPRTVQHHRRWLSQQALTRNVPDSHQESTNEAEPSSPTAKTSVASSKPKSTPSQKGGPKVDAFLASLHTTGSQPSLADLERGRPREYAHPESILYAKQYNEVMEHLARSFSKAQLRQFGEKYQLDPNLWRSQRKVDYARAIVENAWGWPSLRDIEKRKREKTEIVTESKQNPHRSSRLDVRPPPQLSTSHAANCSCFWAKVCIPAVLQNHSD